MCLLRWIRVGGAQIVMHIALNKIEKKKAESHKELGFRI